MAKPPLDNSSSYWRSNNHESPLTPAFPPYPPNVHPHANWSHGPPEPTSRDDLGWTVPQRSMSYGNHESMHHPSAYSPFHQPPSDGSIREDYVSRPGPPPEGYPPTLTPNSNSVSTSEASVSTTSADPIPHVSGPSPLPPPYPNSQGWQPYPYKVPALPSNSEGYPGWYGQNSTLPSHSNGGESMPPPAYGHVEPYGGGMYYPNATQGGR
jgi:hypothetical protein